MTISAQFPSGPGNPLTGAAQIVTVSYQVLPTDAGTWIVVNSTGAVTVTLPATPPNAQFAVGVISIGTGTTTVARNGNNINGVASNSTLIQNQGAVFTTDSTNWFAGLPPNTSQGDTGVLSKVLGYTVLSTDNGKWIVVNDASPATITLPSPASSAPWFVGVINIGAGLVTINPNGLNLNGSAASTQLKTGQGTKVVTDGSNYFCALQALSARTATSLTTGSLVAGATESLSVLLAKTVLIVAVTVSVAARVRLYSTAAAAAADLSRPVASPPAIGLQNEVIMDVNLTVATGLSWIMSPAAWGSDGKATPDGNLAYNIQNGTSGTIAVTVTWTYIALE